VTTRIADIEIPDTTLVDEATELVRDVASSLIFNHSGGSTCSARCAAASRG